MIGRAAAAASPGPVRAVRAIDLSFAYGRGAPALRGVSLEVAAGELCMLLGRSGSGKTTFLRVVKGLLQPSRGRVEVLGVPLEDRASRAARRALHMGVAYIPQSLGLVRSLTALENTLAGALGRTGTFASLCKRFSAADRDEAFSWLERLDIAHKADERVADLSGGERQRVAIARALLQRPQIVLADEFVSHLDPRTTREIMELVTEIAASGVAFLISSHELDVVAGYGTHAVFFRGGEKVHECPAREVDLRVATEWMGRT